MIEDAAILRCRTTWRPWRDGAIGILGISFGGGLSIVAAGRPSLKGRVSWVLAFGGHADLPRTLRYLCTGVQPDGAVRRRTTTGSRSSCSAPPIASSPRPGGAAARGDPVVPRSVAPRHGRQGEGDARVRAREDAGGALDEPARTYMDYVNARDVAQLGPVLLPHVADSAAIPRCRRRARRAGGAGVPAPRHRRQRRPRDRVDAARADCAPAARCTSC
jgi:hypothetical protein